MRPQTKLAITFLIHDILAIYLSFGIAHYFYVEPHRWIQQVDLPLLAITAVTLGGLYIMDVYSLNREVSATRLAVRSFVGVAVAGILTATALYVTRIFEVELVLYRGIFLPAIMLFAVWVSVSRYVVRVVYDRYAQQPCWVVIGTGERAANLMDDNTNAQVGGVFWLLKERGYDAEEIKVRKSDVFGSIDDLDSLIASGVAGVILANEHALADDDLSKMMTIRLKGTKIYDLLDYYEKFLSRVPVMHLQDGWFVMSQGFNLLHHAIGLKIKRLLDVVVAGAGLVILAPVMFVVGALVKIDSSGPMIYSQVRTGVNGHTFRLHKFRTMVQDAEKEGAKWANPNDPRITRVGRFLRISRLDEIPQLWNVLRGEMSFIGPRPERPSFNEMLEKEIPYWDLRHMVKPGLTGWAQVMYSYGSSVLDSRMKLEYDLYYIKNYSLFLDLSILLKTLRVVFNLRGR